MTIRLHVHGNCQAPALAALFASTDLPLEITACEVYRPIDEAGRAALRADIARADVIVLQTVGRNVTPEEYRSDFVAATARPGARVLRMAPIYFRGQQPGLFNLDVAGKRLDVPGMVYVDAIVAWMILRGWSPEVILANLGDPALLAAEDVARFWQHGIDTLAAREAGCDLRLARDIDTLGRTGRIMHSFNHPAYALLARLARRALALAELPSALVPDDGPDLLRYPQFPILPTVAAALGIPQTREDRMMHWQSRSDTLEGYVCYCLRALGAVPRGHLLRALSDTPNLPPVIAALEARHGAIGDPVLFAPADVGFTLSPMADLPAS